MPPSERGSAGEKTDPRSAVATRLAGSSPALFDFVACSRQLRREPAGPGKVFDAIGYDSCAFLFDRVHRAFLHEVPVILRSSPRPKR